MTAISYRPVASAAAAQQPAAPANDVYREAVQSAAERRLARALRDAEQLPRLMRAAGVARVRIDADGQMVIVFAEAVP